MLRSFTSQSAPVTAIATDDGGLFLDRRDAFLAAGARLRTFVFLLAVIAINYTWSRPSPVDAIFLCALLLTPFARQTLNLRSLMLIGLVMIWLFSIYVSSVSLLDKPLVAFQFFALTSVVLIGITSCLVAAGWAERDLLRFVRVYIFANVIAALIGIFGFVTKNPALTWADRPTAFLDDPDMFGVFLIPGMLGSLFMIAEGHRRLLYAACLLLLSVAVLLSFSRAAIVIGFFFSGLSFLFLNRHNLLKASLSALAILLVLGLAGAAFYLTNDTFAQMIVERSKLAQSYDLGQFGRYNRYLLAIPMILDHPLGLGLFEIDKYFPEPIHNIWISAFLNYGWIAGFDWTLLMALTVQQAWYSWKRSRNSLCLLILFSWASIICCAMLHQGERWRFLWLFTGLVWGLNYRNLAPATTQAAEEDDVIVYQRAA
jgi:O-Antigen ligase